MSLSQTIIGFDDLGLGNYPRKSCIGFRSSISNTNLHLSSFPTVQDVMVTVTVERRNMTVAPCCLELKLVYRVIHDVRLSNHANCRRSGQDSHDALSGIPAPSQSGPDERIHPT
jgi:hypothetical protein